MMYFVASNESVFFTFKNKPHRFLLFSFAEDWHTSIGDEELNKRIQLNLLLLPQEAHR